jgi:phosphoribosylformylglycinamidine cyclo-ligase
MEVYLSEANAQRVIEISESFDVEAKIIGRVEKSDKKQVTLKTENGEFVYN